MDITQRDIGLLLALDALLENESVSLAAEQLGISQPAMSSQQLSEALAVGRTHVDDAKLNKADLFIGGEMGIANTTSATALAASQMGKSVVELTGPGTGIEHHGSIGQGIQLTPGFAPGFETAGTGLRQTAVPRTPGRKR